MEHRMALVDSLLTLFRVDGQVRGLRSRLTAAERYLAGQNKQLGDLVQQQNELNTRRKHVQALIATGEVEVKSIDLRIDKLRTELNSASNNKQYSALLTELNTIKVGRGEVEEKMLAGMEQLEQLQQQLDGLQAQIQERTKIRDAARLQLEERQADVGSRLAELETERRQAAAVVPPAALLIFDEMAEVHDGEAMSAIEEVDRRNREYACGACNMHLPFEQVSLLTSAADSLVRCPSCGRILFMQAEMRVSLAKK